MDQQEPPQNQNMDSAPELPEANHDKYETPNFSKEEDVAPLHGRCANAVDVKEARNQNNLIYDKIEEVEDQLEQS